MYLSMNGTSCDGLTVTVHRMVRRHFVSGWGYQVNCDPEFVPWVRRSNAIPRRCSGTGIYIPHQYGCIYHILGIVYPEGPTSLGRRLCLSPIIQFLSLHPPLLEYLLYFFRLCLPTSRDLFVPQVCSKSRVSCFLFHSCKSVSKVTDCHGRRSFDHRLWCLECFVHPAQRWSSPSLLISGCVFVTTT
jgi:hypothetical protein